MCHQLPGCLRDLRFFPEAWKIGPVCCFQGSGFGGEGGGLATKCHPQFPVLSVRNHWCRALLVGSVLSGSSREKVRCPFAQGHLSGRQIRQQNFRGHHGYHSQQTFLSFPTAVFPSLTPLPARDAVTSPRDWPQVG